MAPPRSVAQRLSWALWSILVLSQLAETLVVSKDKLWPPGHEVTIGFDPSCNAEVRTLVKATVPQWLRSGMFLKVAFTDLDSMDVSVGCVRNGGHFSKVGKDSLTARPSMNLDYEGGGETRAEFIGTILHEFG